MAYSQILYFINTYWLANKSQGKKGFSYFILGGTWREGEIFETGPIAEELTDGSVGIFGCTIIYHPIK